MSSVPRYGSDVPPGGLADARDRAGCLVVTGMFDHEMRESVKGASHMAAAVADDPARALPDRGATCREPDPHGFYPGHTRPTGSLVPQSSTVRPLALDPTAQAMSDHFLSSTSEFSSHLDVTAGLNLGSGARPQILHREKDAYSFFPLSKPASSSRTRLAGCGTKRTIDSIRPRQVADRLTPELRTVVGYKMHRELGSCVGVNQARRRTP